MREGTGKANKDSRKKPASEGAPEGNRAGKDETRKAAGLRISGMAAAGFESEETISDANAEDDSVT